MPLLLHLRSIGKRRFSLRLFCFSRSGCRSALRCTSKRSWCLVLLSFRTSLMNGMPRSLWSVEFDTYRGASAIDRSKLLRSEHHLNSVDKKNQLDVTFCIIYFSSNSCSTCFGQPCAHHQELTTAWCYSLVLVCAVAAGRLLRPVGR